METNFQDVIARYIASGEKNQTAFCKREGISYHTFQYHWKRAGTQSTKPRKARRTGFATLSIKEDAAATPAPVSRGNAILVARIFAGGQLRFELEGELSAGFLRELARC